jgi:hypothetical protein
MRARVGCAPNALSSTGMTDRCPFGLSTTSVYRATIY